MDTSIRAPKRVDPRALLDAWAAYGWCDGLLVNQLPVHERLLVKTRHSLYELIVTDPCGAEVLVRGGKYFPEFTRVRVAGCSLGGSFLKVHGIYVAFRIEFVTGMQVVVTSVVESIARAGSDAAVPRLM